MLYNIDVCIANVAKAVQAMNAIHAKQPVLMQSQCCPVDVALVNLKLFWFRYWCLQWCINDNNPLKTTSPTKQHNETCFHWQRKDTPNNTQQGNRGNIEVFGQLIPWFMQSDEYWLYKLQCPSVQTRGHSDKHRWTQICPYKTQSVK